MSEGARHSISVILSVFSFGKKCTHALGRIVLSVDVVFTIVLVQYDDLEPGSDLSGISTAVILVVFVNYTAINGFGCKETITVLCVLGVDTISSSEDDVSSVSSDEETPLGSPPPEDSRCE